MCSSDLVTATVSDPAAPTGTSPQIFCSINNPVISNLTATGSGILWYSAPTGGISLVGTTPLVNGTTYYATQTVGGCESDTRLAVSATVSDPAAPTGTSPQTFCSINNPVISNLTATGSGILWYSAPTGGIPLIGTTPLVNGTTYYATQTVGGCESDTRLAVAVIVSGNPVISAISGETSPACMATGIVYSVILTPGSEYSWSVPPDAIITSGATGPDNNQIIVDFGIQNGNITVTETNVYGCQGSPVQLSVTLQGCYVEARFSANDTLICLSESIIFTDESLGTTPGTSYQWDFGSGAVPPTATGAGPHTVNYSTTGLKTVQLIVNNGLVDTLIRYDYISVNAIPLVSVETTNRCGTGTVDFVATPSDGDQVEFSLDVGTSVILTDNTSPFVYSATVTESSSLQVWARAMNTLSGCSGTWDSSAISQSFEIPVTEPIASAHTGSFPAGYVDVVCYGKTNALYYVNGDPLATYNWRIPELGIIRNDTSEIEVDWTVPGGDYTLELEKISPEGCAGITRDTLVLVSQPYPDLGNNISICQGESHTFDLGGLFSSYQWHDFSTGSSFTASTTGEVSVKVWDDYGCSGSDTTMVTLFNNPIVDLGYDTVVLCGDNSLLLDAGDFAAYDWSTGDITNPITVREGAGTVSVTVTDDNGCQASDEVFIAECTPETLLGTIPNTFTPNEDGFHDDWEIRNIGLFPDADIQIFDRWGRLIYRSDGGYDSDWHGKGPNGNDLPVDTYYYIIDLKVKGAKPITGTVSIIR